MTVRDPVAPDDQEDDGSLIGLALLTGAIGIAALGRQAIRRAFGWDRRTGRYYDRQTRRFVPDPLVQEVVEQRIQAGFDRLAAMLTAVTDGGADIALWQDAFMLELRRAHTQLMALGRGGWDQVTFRDWGRVGAKLRKEYAYMRRFIQKIADGQLSAGQIRVRLQMYADGAWSSYWKGVASAKIAAGAVAEQRFLNPLAEHCADCVGYARQGRVPVGTLPAPGEESECRHRCRCTKKFYRADGSEV